MSTPKTPEEGMSAAEIATNPADTPKPAAAVPSAPKAEVKDEKWLDTEICRHEDELRRLKDLKKTASAPVPAAKPSAVSTSAASASAVKKSFLSGWDCNELA